MVYLILNSVNSLRCLTALDKLEDLRLHDPVRDLSNPLCHSNTYRKDVLDMLPNLKVLDGKSLMNYITVQIHGSKSLC